MTAQQQVKEQQAARDAAELKEAELKDKQVHVFTFGYTLGTDHSGFRSHVLAKNESEARALLTKHLEGMSASFKLSSGTVAVQDVITADTPVPPKVAAPAATPAAKPPGPRQPQPTA